MQRRIHVELFAVLLALSTAACSSDSDDDDGDPGFNGFVSNLIDDTADDTEPVQINGQSFSFSEDENAFDDLFP